MYTKLNIISILLFMAVISSCGNNGENASNEQKPTPDSLPAKVQITSDTADVSNEFFVNLLTRIQEGTRCDFSGEKDQKKNIPQYSFKVDGIPIMDEDNWYLHKGYDGTNVCFVLAVEHTGKAAEYFKGNVPCPTVCGLETDLKLAPCLKKYMDNKVVNFKPILDVDAAALINAQVGGFVYTLAIPWATVLKDLQALSPVYCVLIYCDYVAPYVRPLPGASVIIPYNALGDRISAPLAVMDNVCIATGAPGYCKLKP
jgi:hypothetical protein